ncbi:hypothetical protein KGQ34_02125 [Patescibacteria group bacterium]|nr:hypothetical protein [Patescibacteria group bacterium]
MDEETKSQLQKQRELLEQIFASVEKTRKYFLWTMIATIVLFVVPLIIFLFALPSFLGNLTGGL